MSDTGNRDKASGLSGGDTEKVGRGEDDEAVVVSSDVVSFPKTTTAPSTTGYEGMYPPNDEEEEDENDEEFSNEDASEKKSSEESSDLLDTVKSQLSAPVTVTAPSKTQQQSTQRFISSSSSSNNTATEAPPHPLLTEASQHFLSGLAADSSSEPTTSPPTSPDNEREYFVSAPQTSGHQQRLHIQEQDEDEDRSFKAAFQDEPGGGGRLDTVEEVSEPASSEYWQLESLDSNVNKGDLAPLAASGAGGGGKDGPNGGSLNSLVLDSLPPDPESTHQGVSVHSGQPDLLSITSREEMFSVTEIEVPTVTTVIQTSANTTNEFDDLSKMVGENNEPTGVTVTSFPSNHDRLLSVTTAQKSTTATLSTSRVDSYVVYGQSATVVSNESSSKVNSVVSSTSYHSLLSSDDNADVTSTVASNTTVGAVSAVEAGRNPSSEQLTVEEENAASGDEDCLDEDEDSLSISLPSDNGPGKGRAERGAGLDDQGRTSALLKDRILKILSTDDEDDEKPALSSGTKSAIKGHSSGAHLRHQATIYGDEDDQMGDNQAADEVDFIRVGEGGSRAALPAVSSTRPSSAAVTDTDDSGVSSRPFSSGCLLPPQLPPTAKNQPALPWNKVYKASVIPSKRMSGSFSGGGGGGSTGSSSSPISDTDNNLNLSGHRHILRNVTGKGFEVSLFSPEEGGTSPDPNEDVNEAAERNKKSDEYVEGLLAKLSIAQKERDRFAEENQRIEAELEQQMEISSQAQKKQSNLVNRLQDKVVQYKEKCQVMEARLNEVNELSNQSRAQLGDSADVLRGLEAKLRHTEDRHRGELQQWKVRLEEQQERNNTLVEVNKELRQQLDVATENSDKLLKDVNRLGDNWEKLNRELLEKEKELKTEASTSSQKRRGADKEKLTKVSKELAQYKRQISELRSNTQKKFEALKDDVTEASKNLVRACKGVEAKLSYLDVPADQEGGASRVVHVGTPEEMFARLQQAQNDVDGLQSQSDTLRSEKTALNRDILSLQRALADQEQTIESLRRENGRLQAREDSKFDDNAKVAELRSQNSHLQTSLVDIANAVLDDLDGDSSGSASDSGGGAAAGHGDFGNSKLLTSTPMRPKIMSRSRSFNESDFGGGGRRRTRSVSPAMADSAMTIVQSALNRKQLQVHALKTKLATSVDKVDLLSKSVTLKKSQVGTIEQRWEKEKREADTLRIQLDQQTREKLALIDKLKSAQGEVDRLEKDKGALSREIDELIKDKEETKAKSTSLDANLRTVTKDKARVEKSVDKLAQENKEKLELIGQLEKVGSSLRDELMESRDSLSKMAKDLEKQRRENSSLKEQVRTVSESGKRSVSHSETEVIKLREQETTLKHTLEKLKLIHEETVLKSRTLEDRLSKVEGEELITLKAEHSEAKLKLKSLKEKLSRSEKSCLALKADKENANEQLKSEEAARDRAENELHNARITLEDLQSQVSLLQVQNSGLTDDASSLRHDSVRMKDQLTKLAGEFAALNNKNSENEGLVIALNRRNAELSEKLKADVQFVVDESNQTIADLNDEIDELVREKENLSAEMQELTSRYEHLQSKFSHQTGALEDEVDALRLEKARAETETDELRLKHDKYVKKAKKELQETEDTLVIEREEAKQALEKAHKAEMAKFSGEKAAQVEGLMSEISELQGNLARQKKSHEEEIQQVEMSREQAVTIHQQERAALVEQNQDLTQSLDEANRENEELRRDGLAKSERDRGAINHLNLEVSKLTGQLEALSQSSKSERANLSANLAKEKSKRNEAEARLEKTRGEAVSHEERCRALTEELDDLRSKLTETTEEGRRAAKAELAELGSRLEEAERALSRRDKALADLNSQANEYESDRSARIDQMRHIEAKLTEVETVKDTVVRELKYVKEMLDEARESNTVLESSNRDLKTRVATLQTEYDSLANQHEAVVAKASGNATGSSDEDEADGRGAKESADLRLKVQELESVRKSLERDLASLKAAAAGEEKAVRESVSGLKASLEEALARERRLAAHKHNLELALTDAQQAGVDANSRAASHEQKINLLHDKLEEMSRVKSDLEAKVSSVSNVVHQYAASGSHQRTPSGENRSRANSRGRKRSKSPWRQTTNDLAETVRMQIQNLTSKYSTSEKSRDDAIVQVGTLKKKIDELVKQNDELQRNLSKTKQKLSGSEEQLRKLETKVSVSDISIANQDENLHLRERELRHLTKRLGETSKHLEDLESRSSSSEEALHSAKKTLVKTEKENRKLKEMLQNEESRCKKLEASRKAFEADRNKLHHLLGEKESEIKTLRVKCDSLNGGVSSLEDKCAALASTVDQLQDQLQRRPSSQQRPVEESSPPPVPSDSDEHWERTVRVLRADKAELEQRLSSWRGQAEQLRATKEKAEEHIARLESELQRSETRANATRHELEKSRAEVDAATSSPDVFIRDELARLRRENDNLHASLREHTKKISIMESDKVELETKIEKQKRNISEHQMQQIQQISHVRHQIPMTSSSMAGSGGPTATSTPQTHSHHHALKLKLSEQEIDRQRRKVRALEDQLSELERAHGSRIQELLAERRKEKERENLRLRESSMRAEEALTAKERIYRERIHGLEQQIETLRDQLSKEMKRRQLLISGTSGISSEISMLRSNLDESLMNVSRESHRSTHEMRQSLDRETNRLRQTMDQYTQSTQTSRPQQQNNQYKPTDVGSSARRNLSFDNLETS